MEDNVKPPDPEQQKDFAGSRTRPRKFRIGLVYTAVAAGPKPLTGTAAMEGTGLAPGAGGDATLAQTGPGWRIELNVTGLSRRDNQQYYYEAWLENAAGILVPVGTFNQGPSVTLWAGVSPVDFPTLTVTEQQVGRSQASSGKRVLTGSVDVHR